MYKKGPRQLYHKLSGIYSAMIIASVLVLMAFFLIVTRIRTLDTNRDYLKMLQEECVDYLEECSRRANTIQSELYQSQDELKDLIYYLRHGEEEYQKFRLDRYMGRDSLSYYGFDTFVEQVMKSDSNIKRFEIFSYEKGEIITCNVSGGIRKRVPQKKDADRITHGDIAAEGEFSFLKEIRDPVTLENVGCLLITFSTDKFRERRDYYQKPELLVVNQAGTVILDTLEAEASKTVLAARKTGEEDTAISSYLETGSVKDYTVYAFLEKRKAGKIPFSLGLLIVAIGAGVVFLGELLVYWYLSKLTRRLNYILDGMEKVTVGDLDVRLAADEKGDELDLISANFNDMCGKLDRYIQKSYLAEIEQKNAEIEVLQNQINPHFLYNTLEAIRMKAIINKDRDVAKMLYSMAVIFRSQIKEADIITLVQELHYCKKYLELFEYRYQGKFSFQLDCPEAYMKDTVIKFIVQPILENYFAHGIYGEKEGNFIRVYAQHRGGMLWIHVSDNGRGMEDEQIQEMNRMLRENQQTSRKSIGLINVNRRLKAVYGPKYGVELEKNETGGLHVILKVGIGEEYKDEREKQDDSEADHAGGGRGTDPGGIEEHH